MNLTFTDKAIAKLKQYPAIEEKQLKLKYDIEGCGCVNDGVSVLWLMKKDRWDSDDIVVDTNYVPIIMEKSKLVFFDDDMTIDIVEGKACFQLKSPNQIINPRLMVVEVSDEENEF